MIGSVWAWLTAPSNWSGSDGIWQRVLEHLAYTGLTLLIAAVVAVPVGLWIGHTGKGRLLVVNLANGMRSMPTLGLLFVAVLVLGPRLAGDVAFLVPTIIVLVILAIPPILAGAYAGVEAVPATARDAAKGMGMGPWQVLSRVEVPNALPLLFGGLRSSALQVVATATLGASVSLGGLGRYLIDGQATRNYPMMAGGAILVGVLALLVDLVLALVQRAVVSPGLSRQPRPRARRRPARASAAASP